MVLAGQAQVEGLVDVLGPPAVGDGASPDGVLLLVGDPTARADDSAGGGAASADADAARRRVREPSVVRIQKPAASSTRTAACPIAGAGRAASRSGSAHPSGGSRGGGGRPPAGTPLVSRRRFAPPGVTTDQCPPAVRVRRDEPQAVRRPVDHHTPLAALPGQARPAVPGEHRNLVITAYGTGRLGSARHRPRRSAAADSRRSHVRTPRVNRRRTAPRRPPVPQDHDEGCRALGSITRAPGFQRVRRKRT